MDFMKLVQQAGRLQEKIDHLQEAVGKIEVEGQAGGGAVTVKARGNGIITGVWIDPGSIPEWDAAIVQDLVLAATQDAQDKAVRASAEMKNEMIGDLGLPAGLKLPF